MSAASRLPLDAFYEREARHPRQRFLVQPTGGGQVETLTWADVGHQARCAAHWLRARELPQGSHIALISKKTAPTGSSPTWRSGWPGMSRCRCIPI
ncbi:hypothetical protein ACFS4T_09250 [Pseudomonas lini]